MRGPRLNESFAASMSAIMRQGELLPFGEPGVNPYLIPRPALIALSGGRTSGKMVYEIKEAYGGTLPEDIIVSFSNTGKEDERTLVFVHEMEKRWNIKVYWVEFDPNAEERTKFVSFETASRNGEPLAEVIRTRPTQHLFNVVSRYCSPSTKSRRMQKLMHHFLGYESWHVALGFRADEMHRVAKAKARSGRDREYPVCPLAEAGVTKLDVMDFWNAQPFDLQLPNVEGETPLGNCDLCPLKHPSKLVNALRMKSERADWWISQEDRMAEVIKDIPARGNSGRSFLAGFEPDEFGEKQAVYDWDPNYVWPELRHRFFKDGTSYRDLLARAEALNAAGAPMEAGYDTDTGIDCNCTD
jgi:3'-phosphoadenosine 5'-phosphosulfate sulfotransferase (PAPS reductase)/FAD synthetase